MDYLLIYLPTQVRLTLTKIIKIVATRWWILRLKCTKFDFGWGSIAPDPAGGAYSAPPDPLAGFVGLLLRKGKGREGRGGCQCHAKIAENAASVHNICLDKIVYYLQRIFNRNQKLKQQVSKLNALKLDVCLKINACYIFVCIFFHTCQN